MTTVGELQLSAFAWLINTGAECVPGKQVASVNLADDQLYHLEWSRSQTQTVDHLNV